MYSTSVCDGLARLLGRSIRLLALKGDEGIVLELRILNEKDAKNYWELRLQSLQTEPFAFGKSVEEHAATTVESVATRLGTMAPDFTLGAFEGDALIGIATFIRESGTKDRHKGRIYGVYVKPAHRQKKIGKALIESLLRKVREDSSIEQVLISVTTRQDAARRLYRSIGFQPFGIEPRALKVGSEYVDEEHMVLVLR